MAYEDEIENKIIGDSLEECRNKLYNQYGKDYRITNKTVEIRSTGLFHLRKKAVTVVTYVVNHQKSYNNDSYVEYNPMLNMSGPGSLYSDRRTAEAETLEKNRLKLLETLQNQPSNSSQLTQITQSLEDFKNEFKKEMAGVVSATQQKHESIRRIEELLEQNEFSFSYINFIEDKIRNDFSLEQLENFDLVQRRVVDWIGESIEIAKPVTFRPPHVFILVGPTGVGKTTTLVKLAVQFVKSYAQNRNGEKPKICFISTDSMRVGAMESLERWGKHLGSPVYKAEKPEDLKTLYDENRNNVDAIFIDTSGFSPNDATHIAQMKVLVDIPGMNPDIYLVATASTKSRDLKNIMQNYELFGYKSVIVTKCDESVQLGNVISVLNEKHKAISYITHGQVASRDISRANVIEFLKRLDGFEVDRVHIEDKFGE